MLEVDEHTRDVLTSCGFPEGARLSPILFLVFFNDLFYSLSSLHFLKAHGSENELVLWIYDALRDGNIHPILREDLMRAE